MFIHKLWATDITVYIKQQCTERLGLTINNTVYITTSIFIIHLSAHKIIFLQFKFRWAQFEVV